MSTPTDLKLRQDTEIQGDIIAGFKKDYVRLLLLQFNNAPAARAWLEKITPQIATTAQVADFNERFSKARQASGGDDPSTLKATWLGLSFTYPGLQFITGQPDLLTAEQKAGDTLEAFIQGPADPGRAIALGDTDDNDPKFWTFGCATKPTVHAVLTIASDTQDGLDSAVAEQRVAASRASAVVVFEQEGAALPGSKKGKEHFGFKDGVSEPGVLGFDERDPARSGNFEKAHPGTRLIPPGEFVIGRQPAEKHDPGTAARKTIPAWMTDGSFQVVRRLEQDVAGWWAQVDRQLQRLKDLKAVPQDTTRDWFAARLVGRWRNGAPVCKYPDTQPADPATGSDNDFLFADDPDGLTTPLYSHLRKSNPRDGLIDGTPVDEVFMDARRIMRRGAPYGQPFDPTSDVPDNGPDAARGLLFVCYQADLVAQFEFIQVNWINDPDFPPGRENKPGPDPMVSGQLATVNDGKVNHEGLAPSGERQTSTLDFRPFVRTRGALYCFTPSITTLRRLAQGRLTGELTDTTQPVVTPQPVVAQNLPMDAVLPLPDVPGRFWTFQQGTIRLITTGAAGSTQIRQLTTGAVDDRTGVVVKTVGPYSSWPALKGVTQIDTILPVPDEQQVNGKSSYWLFHTVNGTQVYRFITITAGEPYTSQLLGDDQPLSRWASFGGSTAVTQVDAFLPVPDRRPAGDGTYWYWMFHNTSVGQRHRLISIGRSGQAHPDRMQRDDRKLTAWASLEGVTRVDAFLPVPGRDDPNGGQHWYWVFHQDQYRVIMVAHGGDHQDDLLREDRPTAVWSRQSSVTS
ncbi:Dyp-type peroxidase [Kitasatospora kifunensis]|uniref:Dyp-type peroxidase family n=1 Tax=Kitasatospora kifunensis TaxID=58351 RepID=A0A7W7R8P0_KITKI|nr:Dyp-type peroxidase [Kitasatospora kifunensis]MBB4927512.1 Dyp-type peroxidase family [Kitasatospora kifunensis]